MGEVYGIYKSDYGYVLGTDQDGKYVILVNTGIKKEDSKFLKDDRIYKVVPNKYIHTNLPSSI